MGDMQMIPDFPYKAATYRVVGQAFTTTSESSLPSLKTTFPICAS